MKNRVLSCCSTVLFILTLLFTSLSYGADAVVLTINKPISPATEEYIVSNLQEAKTKQASLVIIQLDTPGGLATSMNNINNAILTSSIPVVTYVAPLGARAASAGTFILYASSVAAMAPGTHVGAASPISIHSRDSKKPNIKTQLDEQNLSTSERKAMNDAIANIRSLAELHHRNVAWAELAVRQAASLSATDALKQQVIDVIVNGQEKILQTDNLTVTTITPNWRFHFLSIITDPNIAYILLLLGIYGLFFEFYNPGMVLPGVVGVISMLIALYAYELLPVNAAGFALLLLGITFIVIEIIVSSMGILGLGGVIAFVTGSILLLDVQGPGYQIAWSLVAMMTIFTVGFFILAITTGVHAMKQKVLTGEEALIGAEGTVLEYTNSQWHVSIQGEMWQAQSEQPLHVGQHIRVLGLTGLVLTVEPITRIHEPTMSHMMD
jgi:membrane-bound serine protease (ClpP class)